MNKTTHVAPVRRGDFNFPAQISLCTAVHSSVVYQCCCQGGGLSQAPCLLPVFVFDGRATEEGFVSR